MTVACGSSPDLLSWRSWKSAGGRCSPGPANNTSSRPGEYEEIFPALAKSRIGQVSVECINSHVPLKLLSLLGGKDVLIGVIDVATDKVETPQQVEQVIAEVMKFVPKEKIVACTNCGMAPMRRDIAEAKLKALGQGVALARKKFG